MVRLAHCILLLPLLGAMAAAQAVLNPADKAFIQEAGVGSTHELQLSMIVAKRSTDAEVKNFARRMLDDHSKASSELKAILSHRNVSAPDDLMDPEHTDVLSRLQQMGGSDFDRLYITTMVGDHQHALTVFQTEAQSGGDPEVKAFAARQIATIQQHLAQAQGLAARLGAAPPARATNH